MATLKIRNETNDGWYEVLVGLPVDESPAGAIDGVNVTFTLAATPAPDSLMLFLNGLLQIEGAGDDFTLAADVITMGSVLQVGDVLRARYIA